ncbi:MAG: HD domain-containing protein [Prevotellaceae bacterium]|jgi:HD superfamily phosphohydrolase|nr:HD domain-containing protein [Prevotellaceae bacterium]
MYIETPSEIGSAPFLATNKRKIINDPVFGFINIPNTFIFDLIQHRYFQRLHRIKQLGLTSFVYPGAQHTRLQHALGALYLTAEAIKELRAKGHNITPEEADGVMAAILLHDIGHSPFSHALEHTFVENMSHEAMSRLLMERMNIEMNGQLSLAIQIFTNKYSKTFLHQLISSQLDMDRLDYLRRDSFFTGVVEGAIGSSRIIKMLDVHNDTLVVEHKGIYSIENFLVARRFMYWQVYLHKTAMAAEVMLLHILKRAKELVRQEIPLFATPVLHYFLAQTIDSNRFHTDNEAVEQFIQLDDADILAAIKVWSNHTDSVLSTLSRRFINRQLFKSRQIDQPLTAAEKEKLSNDYQQYFSISPYEAGYFFAEQTASSDTYNLQDDKIMILYNNGEVRDILQVSDMLNPEPLTHHVEKRYLCYCLLK